MKSNQLILTLCGVLFAGAAYAAAAGSIELKTTAQQEKVVVAADGSRHTEIVPAARVLPGTEVIYTIRYRNIGSQPASNVVVDDPIPAHMHYVAGSAKGENTAISYSIDGKTWAALPDELEIDNGNGTTRTGTARDVTRIRWAVGGELAPGAQGTVSFRAVLE